MTVLYLDQARRLRNPRCLCRDGWVCYPHRIADLADRLRLLAAETTSTALLVPADQLEDTLTDALAVLDSITRETDVDNLQRPTHERDTPRPLSPPTGPASARARVGTANEHTKRDRGVGL